MGVPCPYDGEGGVGGVRGAVAPSGPPAAWPHPRAGGTGIQLYGSSARGAERWGRSQRWKPTTSCARAGSEKMKDSFLWLLGFLLVPLKPVLSSYGCYSGRLLRCVGT